MAYDHPENCLYVSNKDTILSIGAVHAVLYQADEKTPILLHITKELCKTILDKAISDLPDEVLKITGKRYDFSRLKFRTELYPPFRRVFVDLTNRCNFKCQDCFHAGDMLGDIIQDEVLNKILQLPTSNNTTLAILGGEPLLYPRKKIFNVLDKFATKFHHQDLYTNGSLLKDEKLINFLKEKKICIKLTFYAVAKKKHDTYTGVEGAFNHLINLVDKLAKNGNVFNVSLILDKDDIVKYRRSKSSIFHKPPLKERLVKTEIRRPSMCNKIEGNQLIDRRYMDCGATYRPLGLVNFNKIITNLNYHTCYAGAISIDTKGNVYNCPWVREKCLGNILDWDFKKEDIRKYLDWEQPLWKLYEDCLHCEFNFLCRDCPYMNDTTAKMKEIKELKKPYYCKYDPISGEYDNKK